jgi:signal peptidase II
MMARRPYALVSLAVFAFDQLTKWLVQRSLELHEFRPLIDGLLSLSHVRNRGAAFGILSDADLPFQPLIFAAVSFLALAAIAIYAWRLPAESRLPQTALALIMGGALGNLFDRARLGYVVDFVHVYWNQHQWPDFNVADSAISVGVSLLILDILREGRSEQASAGEIAEAGSPAGRTD